MVFTDSSLLPQWICWLFPQFFERNCRYHRNAFFKFSGIYSRIIVFKFAKMKNKIYFQYKFSRKIKDSLRNETLAENLWEIGYSSDTSKLRYFHRKNVFADIMEMLKPKWSKSSVNWVETRFLTRILTQKVDASNNNKIQWKSTEKVSSYENQENSQL